VFLLIKVPKWKDENRETYIKYLQSFINRLERKQYRSEYEEKRLESLKNKLKTIEKRD